MKRRRYTDEERATALAALDANGGNIEATAGLFGIPRSTLQSWVEGHGQNAATPKLRQEKKAELSERLEEVAHQLLDALPGKVGDASLQQIATAFGIAVDKMQLLKGEPTSINQNASISDEERADRVISILERARARRAG